MRTTRRPVHVRLVVPAILALVAGAGALAGFDDDFTGAVLRVDLHHSGTATEEHLSVDRLRVEGPWPGSRTRLLDESNLGRYLIEMVDAKTNRALYRRGFDGVFGEWETTGEARAGTWRSIEEAVRVPEPRRPVQLRLRKRGSAGTFGEIWTTTVDPASRFVDRPTIVDEGVWIVEEHGDPAVKVDLLFLGDGYAAADAGRFRDDVLRSTAALFAEEPYASRRTDFNVRAITSPARQSGVTRPRDGVFRDSPLGVRYNTFDSRRYVMTMRDRRWRDVAARAPYDAVVILVNERTYGGGGIYGLYATAAAGSAFAPYLVVHEFGHHFAALGDEYFTSPVAYEGFAGERPEPDAPNVTALADPAALKWRDLVADDTPVPTPWPKDEFERRSRALQARRAELRAAGVPEEDVEALFREEQAAMTALLAGHEHAGRVGAFEGALYESEGYYRPEADCLMFTRDEVGFCAVCRRAIEAAIDRETR